MLDWLDGLGLGKYASVFEEHEITREVLPHLTEADIDALHLPIGARRRLIVAIQALIAGSPQPASPSASTPTAAFRNNAPDAERRQLTVMFCDLVGSTAMAERLDPEELREQMQTYRKAVSDVAAHYDGYVAQYLGDGLMLYFGWPRAHEDDAERCVRAALEIVQAVKNVSVKGSLAVRIGAATGTVVVGESAQSGEHQGNLAVGETPNLAARVQELARPDEILIARSTRRLIGDRFALTELGTHPLKGVAEPLGIWRVDAVRQVEGRFEAAHHGDVLTPLVGRGEELALLLGAWQQARNGDGRVVVVAGEAGIGKSRLVRVLREQLEGERYTALRYQCSPYHLNSALHPIAAQLEFAAGITRDDSADVKLDKLEAVLAGSASQVGETAFLVASLLSLPTDRYPAVAMSPQKKKEKTLEALAGQVEALSRRAPVLMVFEDVHWIDPTSLEALDVLIPRLEGLAVLLVITCRPEFNHRWSHQAHLTPLGLGRLGRQQGAELVGRVAGGRGLPAEVLDQIVAHTDGVPLFVEELTKSVLESGLLRESGDEYTLQTPLPALAVPTSLRDSLLARLDRLAPVKDLIQIGACIGREFSYELIARVSGFGDAELEDSLQKLTDAGLVYRRGTPPDATYTFKHALMQDAAYDFLLKGRRAQLHAQIAQTLQEEFADQVAREPELLAHHYTQSGNLAEAIPLWHKAGDRAVRRFALQEALAHLNKGLSLTERMPPGATRDGFELSLRESLNLAWTGMRGWAAPEVASNAAAILEIATRQSDPHGLLLGLWATWSNTITHGRIEESLQVASRLLEEGLNRRDDDLEIFGHLTVTISRYYMGHLVEARDQSTSLHAMYDPARAAAWMQLTSLDVRTFAEVWSSQWTWMLGYPDEAVRVSDTKDVHARELGNAFNLGFVLTLGAYVFDYRGEPSQMLERVTEADSIAREQSIPFLSRVQVPLAEGLARLRAGELDEAVASLRRGIQNWNNSGGHIRIPYVKAALAEALALQGNLDEGLVLIDECLEQINRPGWRERSHLAEVLRVKGSMLIRQGATQQAETCLREAIAWAREQQAKSWELRASTTLAEVLLSQGQRDAARELLVPIYNWFTEGFETGDLRAARRLLDSVSTPAASQDVAAGL